MQQDTIIARTFTTTASAVKWLTENTGLWAGVDIDTQHSLYESLETQGRVIFFGKEAIIN